MTASSVSNGSFQDQSCQRVCWIMGRTSFQTHVKDTKLFRWMMDLGKPEIIKVVVSQKWNSIPETLIQMMNEQGISKESVYLARSFKDAVNLIKSCDLIKDVSEAWNIGGPGLYAEQLEMAANGELSNDPFRLYITKVHSKFPCDTFYPSKIWEKASLSFKKLQICEDVADVNKRKSDKDSGVEYTFEVYEFNCLEDSE